jgi:hypothetical protein
MPSGTLKIMPKPLGPQGHPEIYLRIHGPFWCRTQDGSRVPCAKDDAEWTTFGFSLDDDFRGMEFGAAVTMTGAHSLPPAEVVKEAELALLDREEP